MGDSQLCGIQTRGRRADGISELGGMSSRRGTLSRRAKWWSAGSEPVIFQARSRRRARACNRARRGPSHSSFELLAERGPVRRPRPPVQISAAACVDDAALRYRVRARAKASEKRWLGAEFAETYRSSGIRSRRRQPSLWASVCKAESEGTCRPDSIRLIALRPSALPPSWA